MPAGFVERRISPATDTTTFIMAPLRPALSARAQVESGESGQRLFHAFHREGLGQARDNGYGSGALWRYAQNVGPAYKGAVTHPGAAAERHVYADI